MTTINTTGKYCVHVGRLSDANTERWNQFLVSLSSTSMKYHVLRPPTTNCKLELLFLWKKDGATCSVEQHLAYTVRTVLL